MHGRNIEPVGEDFSKSIEDLAEHAGEVALEIYRAQLNKGSKQIHAFSKAIDAAKKCYDGFWLSSRYL